MAAKMKDTTFLNDVSRLLRTGLAFDPAEGWLLVHDALVTELPGSPWKGAE